MPKSNYGFKGEGGQSLSAAVTNGATVQTQDYPYFVQLSAVTASTTYPAMAADPGSQTALFSTPNTLWTTLFGATTSSSGYVGTPYSASFSGFDGPADITVAVIGTLRITGTVSGDDVFSLTYMGSGTQIAGVGDYNGYSGTSVNWTVTNASGPYRLLGGNVAATNLTIWLVPN